MFVYQRPSGLFTDTFSLNVSFDVVVDVVADRVAIIGWWCRLFEHVLHIAYRPEPIANMYETLALQIELQNVMASIQKAEAWFWK